MSIPSFLPSKLQDRAISLAHLGVDEYAWIEMDAHKVVQDCRTHMVPILGGDVLTLDPLTQEIEYSYDNWYIESEDADDIVDSSCDYAQNRISFYAEVITSNRSPRIPIFALVFGNRTLQE